MNNYIKRYHDTERWANIIMPDLFADKFFLEVSNYGIVKRTDKNTNQSLNLKQFLVEGFPQSKFTIMEPRSEKDTTSYLKTRIKISDLEIELSDLKEKSTSFNLDIISQSELFSTLESKQSELEKTRKNYKIRYKKNEQKRKKTFGNLVHRWVAEYFCEKPSDNHTLVAHIDHDKLNNHHSNLKWMTRAECTIHNLKNPLVVKSKIKAASSGLVRTSKLTTSQVSILKKRMNEGVSLTDLSKRYPVTQTQLLRIKRGENWAKVPAAR